MNEAHARATTVVGDSRVTWKVLGVLMVGALVGTWAVLPYQLALTEVPFRLVEVILTAVYGFITGKPRGLAGSDGCRGSARRGSRDGCLT